LFEAGREAWCDRILFVAAPLARRETWAQAQRGWTKEELARREARLLNEAQKRARCTDVLENDGSLAELDQKAGACWQRWFGA
jgi:dephospho-CoA kinase